MAWCPNCYAEYEERAKECMDCHVPLEKGAPPARADQEQPASLARIRVFFGPTAVMESELARNVLEAEDIECVLDGTMGAEMLPGTPIFLSVAAQDAERALELISAFLDNPEQADSSE
jgi:hypothetical protein